MITVVPLPRWSALARLCAPTPPAARLAAPWLDVGQDFRWFSRSSWALHALASAWAKRHGSVPTIWVPAYFCNATLDPLRRTGARIQFFPVGPDLEPHWAECTTLAAISPPHMILSVHYFGRPAQVAAARAFADTYNAVLIEDCAHVLRPENGIGSLGDYVLWSPHKLLAIPHGGLLAMRGHARLPAKDLLAPEGATPPMAPWLIKRVVQKTVPAAWLPDAGARGMTCFHSDPANPPCAETPRPSAYALRLLAGEAALDTIAPRRRLIGQAIATALAPWGKWTPLFDPATITPYRLVMRCASPEIAAERFDACRRRGIPVESWPDMPPEVRADPSRFGAAVSLRRTLLCFPCHQGLNPKELAAALGA